MTHAMPAKDSASPPDLRLGTAYLYMGTVTGPYIFAFEEHLTREWTETTTLMVLVHTGHVPYIVLARPLSPSSYGLSPKPAPSYVRKHTGLGPLVVEVPNNPEFGLFVSGAWLSRLDPSGKLQPPIRLRLRAMRQTDGSLALVHDVATPDTDHQEPTTPDPAMPEEADAHEVGDAESPGPVA